MSSTSSSTSIARAATLLAERPVPLDQLLADLLDGLQVRGASLVQGKGIEQRSLASVGDTEGTSVLIELPVATFAGLHLFGSRPSEDLLAPWVGLLTGALARASESGGDPHHRLYSAGSLMRAMAHDLRNLLGVFDQNVQFVEQGLEELSVPVPATIHEDIGQVQEATERVLSYVQRVHELAHVLQGPWSPEPGSDVFARGLRGFDGPQDSGLHSSVEVEEHLPTLAIDATRVELLAAELVSNATHAGASRVRLSVSTTLPDDPLLGAWASRLPAGPHVYFTCSDNGAGMDVFVLARCGEPLFSHPPGSDRSGLGFSLVRAVLGAVGGQMAVTAVGGQGSRVVLAIPAATHPGPGSAGEVTPLVPVSERLSVAVRLAPGEFRDWALQTLEDAQFNVVDRVSEAIVLIADRAGADHFPGPPMSFFFIGSGWPAGMRRPDALMPPQPDRGGFIRRLSMAVARRARRV